VAVQSHFTLPDGEDTRLRSARALIEDEAVSVLSLDVFDTLLWRQVPRPTDAFYLLGCRLKEQKVLRDWVDPQGFRRLRIQAEWRARQRRREAGGGEEVALHDIYAEFARNLYEGEPGLLEEAEVRLECDITVPDLDIAALADLAVSRGCRLILVSNTYLRRSQLARLVQRPEVPALVSATIYPSSAYGVHKANGLWDVVLRDLGVAPNRVLHVGDDPDSDVHVPATRGVRVAHFRRNDAEGDAVLRREGALPPELVNPSGLVVHPVFGDHGITALRNKVVAKADLAEMPTTIAAAWRYGAQVLGPVLTGFADWVHEWAVANGERTLWCLMREGEFLADLINRVAAERRSEVTAVPIWLSRHATTRASLYRADEAELRSLLSRRVRPTVSEFLTTLGLGLGEVPELRAVANRRLDDPRLVDDVLGRVAGNAHLRQRIIEESVAARQRLLGYLLRTVGDARVLPLVDLGWGGTIQTQLDTTLAVAGVPVRTIGLYLATNEGCTTRVLDGREMHGYLTAFGEPAGGSQLIARSPEVLEQVSLASTGSLIDFTEGGEPVLDSSVPPADQLMSKLATQRGVKAYQIEWLRYRPLLAEGGHWAPPADTMAPALLSTLVQSIIHPTGTEARTFGAWTHEDNFGAESREAIIPERLGRVAPYLTPPDLLAMRTTDVYWPMGLATHSDPVLASLTSAVLSGELHESAFDADRSASHMELYHDWGAGYAGPARARIRHNRNGLSYARFALEHPGMMALRLDPIDRPAVVRIDWIEIAGMLEGGAMTRTRLETERDFAALTYGGCRWLFEGVLLSVGPDPQIHLPLAHLVGGPMYSVDVQVAFAAVELPQPAAGVDLSPADFGTTVLRTASKVRAELAVGGVHSVTGGARRVARRALRR
jgi:FMN phosphatase YigB (HAD superfamily)